MGLLPGVYFLALTEGIALLLRRWYDPIPARIRIVFLIAIVLLLGGVLFGGSVLLPLDNLRTAFPFRDLPPSVPPGHGVQGAGGWPLWNPLAGAGMPLLADPQAQALQPLIGLASPLPFWASIGVTAASRIWLAMTFFFLLLRRQRLAIPAACAGAFAFGLSGFLMLWLGWPMATCAALLPVAVYAATLCDERGERRDYGLLGLASAALLLGGHPETMLYALGLLTLFLLDRARRRGRAGAIRLLARTGGTLLLAAGLAAPVLLPTLDFLPTTARAVMLGHRLSPEASAAGPAEDLAIVWRQRATQRIAAVVAPRAFGTLDFYWGHTNAIEDGSGFVGMAATLLAGLALVPLRGRRRAPQEILVACVLVASLALIAQPEGLDRLLAHLPGFKATLAHKNHRVLMLVAFGLAYLSACELDRWLRGDRLRGWCLATVLALATATTLAFAVWTPPAGLRLAPAFQGVPLAAQLGVLALGAALLLVPWRTSSERAAWALCALVAAELLTTFRATNPPAPARLVYPPVPSIRFLIERTGDDRIVGVGNSVFSANFAAVFGLRDVRINNPSLPITYAAATSPLQRVPLSVTPAFGRPLHPLYGLLGVRYVVARPGSSIALPLVLRHPAAWIYERPNPLPRLFLPDIVKPHLAGSWIDFLARNRDFGQRALVTEPPGSANRLDRVWKAASPEASTLSVVAESPTWIAGRALLGERRLLATNVFQDRHWRVLAGGRPVPGVLTNGAFAGAWLPAGELRVDLLYRPTPWWIGCLLCALALALATTLAAPPPARMLSFDLDGPPHS
jgi:hypothetical protein